MVVLGAAHAMRYQRDEKIRNTRDPVARRAIKYQFKQAAKARREAAAADRRAAFQRRRSEAIKKRAGQLSKCVKKCGKTHRPKVYK